uniref:Tudor domain-containing protein 1 n=1 Tax=Gasterosteus aculeatus aculeatus TaxID=481459 RepID=A0AAQ4QZE9_GASAC
RPTSDTMYRAFSPNLLRPNLPLRKPSSGPVALSTPRPPAPSPPLSLPDATAACTVSGFFESTPPPLTVNFCNYCGQQGNLRCKRCKKMPYCSVACQTEDWKAHRRMCKPFDPEPQIEKPKETTASDLLSMFNLCLLKQSDASSLQRVYLKDLHMTKIIKGADIQASVLEFYSPGRFFLLAQNPKLLEALQNISTELQKTYSCPSVTTYVPHVGEVCAVKFSCDLNWYRGLVQTLTADQKTANILYIDFGNEENVPVDRIKPLAANIQPFSPCAMQCRISGVVPTAGSWSSECCILVKPLLAGKILTTRMVETHEDGCTHSVDITLPMGKNLSRFLLDHGYAEEEAVNTAPTKKEIDAMVTASLDNFRRLSDGKDDNTWAQLPEPLTQAVGDAFYVLITHFQSPSEMIVQKVENAGVIRELQLKLREHCSQAPAPQNFRPAPGTVCCAQFSEDKQWYRAKVLGYSSEERICVGYLDFGNSEEVDLANLQPISTSLLAMPMQAIPCGLAGVRPVGESWTEDCVLALQRRVVNRILRIEITGEHDGKLLVTMIDEASDPQANMAELLSSAGFAIPVPTVSDQQAEKTASAAVDPQEPTAACEPLVWSCTRLPCDGQTVALLASVVENPQEFYCRVNNPTDHQQLIELGAELKEHCEAKASPFVPKVGEPCCAMFPGDGKWHRAMVMGLSEDVSVYFVDYGYSMKVEKNHLRSITARLLTLPFQAICCWLTGVEPVGSEWTSEAMLYFDRLVDGKQLSARVLSVTDQGYGLKLESRGKDVATALISEQLAKDPGALEAETVSGHTHQEKGQENDHSPKHAHSNQATGVSLEEMPTEDRLPTPSKAPGFPVDWKAVELPLNTPFQPRVAAISGPSLFYLIIPVQVDQQKLQEVMTELAAYCCDIPASLSSSVSCKPAVGAACCARFSADNNWYRAVVVEVGENEASVIYADYGNAEKVPFSRILPIPMSLLQLPFQVTRCTLNGNEHLPANLPDLLLSGFLATVQSFNGTENVLTLALPTENGGRLVSAMIRDAPKAEATSSPRTPGLRSKSGTQKGLESTAAATGPPVDPEPEPQTPQQKKNTSAVALNGWSNQIFGLV